MVRRNHDAPSIAIDGREITNEGTGIGRYTKNLIINLLKIDKTTRYYVLTNGENVHLGEYENLTVLSSKSMKRGVWERKFVPEVLKKYKVSLFHNTRSGNTFFQPLDIPYVTTVHDIIPLKFQDEFPEKVVDRWKNFFPPYIDGARHIITVSKKTTEDLVAWTGIDKSKISIVYQGIDPMCERISKENAKLLMKQHYDLEQPYILTIGRKQHYKNIQTLLKACCLLPDQLKQDVKLVITGNGVENYQPIINELSLQEYVKPLGYVPEELLSVLYSGSELFAFPSLYEGFGLPPLEAMAYGVPVISSGIDTMKEILGDAAVYFDPNNPQDIAEKIKLMLNDSSLCKEISEKGLEQVKKYSWEETARQTLQVYRSLLN
ncbi:glycosyltransferase family 4 protein [Bacillus songklensis]|uniref:Glycosyltransferase family 4 protein n=1 Tax=Bacillus songklensis TaxID=1069116 RepID=A0ABV8B9L2_9BACI